MKPEHEVILKRLEEYLLKNPKERFGQALFNMTINQFAKLEWQEGEERLLRDIYYDKDEDILNRILNRKTKNIL